MKKILNLKSGLFIAILGIATLGGFTPDNQFSGVSSALLKNMEALATSSEINPACPNGCLTTEGSCFCYYYYELKEKVWSTN